MKEPLILLLFFAVMIALGLLGRLFEFLQRAAVRAQQEQRRRSEEEQRRRGGRPARPLYRELFGLDDAPPAPAAATAPVVVARRARPASPEELVDLTPHGGDLREHHLLTDEGGPAPGDRSRLTDQGGPAPGDPGRLTDQGGPAPGDPGRLTDIPGPRVVGRSGLARIEDLSLVRRAFVLSEVFGPPRAERPWTGRGRRVTPI